MVRFEGWRVFDENAGRYDRWFDANGDAYRAELEAVRRLLPSAGRFVEIGAGTGRFALPLGVRFGAEPSANMARLAAGRGLLVVQADGESLPFKDGSFDAALLVTVLCFVERPERLIREAVRVLVPGGRLVVGILDAGSPAGAALLERREESLFYRAARFRSADDVCRWMVEAGSSFVGSFQTLLPGESPYAIRVGHGQGAFAALGAARFR